MSKAILYETHMHTPLCGHAIGEPEEYAEVAENRGLKGIIVTCHNPIPRGVELKSSMAEDDLETYFTMVERARNVWQGRVDVRLGLEFDYLPGEEARIESQLKLADFEYRLGSVHPSRVKYKNLYLHGESEEDIDNFYRTYYDHLAMSAETGLFHTISHPDMAKLVRFDVWNVYRIIDDIRRSLDRIAKTNCCIEINTSGIRKAVHEFHPGPLLMKEIGERNIPVVLGADAHRPEMVALQFEQAFDLMKLTGIKEVNVCLGETRDSIDIDRARNSLKKPIAVK